MWSEKVFRAIVRSLDNIKKLEKVETEDTARIGGAGRFSAGGPSIATYEFIDMMGRCHSGPQKANEWLFPSDFVLFFNLLTDLGIFKSVEILLDIRSSS